MIDNHEYQELTIILEELEDEKLAVELLRELSSTSSELGKKILNLDQSLSNEDWKKDCDRLKNQLNEIVIRIKKLAD